MFSYFFLVYPHSNYIVYGLAAFFCTFCVAKLCQAIHIRIFYRIAFGCSTHIRLPADDPDGDIVRCRWSQPTECRQACANVPTDAVKLKKVYDPSQLYNFR